MMQTNLTIIVLTYNSQEVIEGCLSNINYDKYKVIVVDNGSSDDCVKLVREKFPLTHIIEIGKNIGFGRANNVALSKVDTEFALVLNPDAIIKEVDINKVLDVMKSDKSIATSGPMVFEEYDVSNEMIENYKQKMERDFSTIKDMYYEKFSYGYDSRFISGACIFLRMEIFNKIGFFDERIFMFYEDDELCLRAKNNGYKNITLNTAIFNHIGGNSCKKTWRISFLRSWHLKGWSKLHWKRVRKGEFKARKSALRLSAIYLIKSLFSLAKFNSNDLANSLGAFVGSLFFLIGFGSFKSNGNPRG